MLEVLKENIYQAKIPTKMTAASDSSEQIETADKTAMTEDDSAATDAAAKNQAKKDGSTAAASVAAAAAAPDRKKEAMNLLVAGKRHLLVKELEAAVESFGTATELLATEYGEAAFECADAYFFYGKALLELARAEAGVFGNALDGSPETEEEGSDDDEEEDGDEGDEEDNEASTAVNGEDRKEDEEGKETEPEKSKDEAEEKEDIGGEAAEAKEGEDQKAQEAEDVEDPSNLQLAWEILELAKVAYSARLKSTESSAEEKKAVEAKVCETLLTLGEVSLESETYDQAVVDITECLNRRKELLAADSRQIAETYYNLGLALGHYSKFEAAVGALEDSIKVLKLRMENLKNKCESKDNSKADDAFYTREREITELVSLVPEIEEKIQDTKDMKKEAEKSGKEEAGFGSGGSTSSSGAGAKPISTIAVKRKAEAGESVSPKKAHLDN